MSFTGLLCAAAALITNSATKPMMRIERLFGPEIKTGPYKHPASITELDNGDLYVVYYGGKGEYFHETGVFGSRLRKGESKFSRPIKLASDPFRSVGNGVIWQAPDHAVWLFYVVRWGDTWSSSRIQGKISRDGCRTWSDSFVVSDVEGMMVRGRPIVLTNGDYLLPVYHETGHDREKLRADSTSRFLRFDKVSGNWKPSGIIKSENGNIQPAVAQLTPEKLVAYCRRGGGYDPKEIGYIVRSESVDGGKTWADGVNSAFPNPNAAVDFLKLKSGALLLIYNNSMTDRTPLTAALSTDADKSWHYKRNIATGPFDYAYPYVIQTRDGLIHLVYTSHERAVVNHAVFNEAWVRGK